MKRATLSLVLNRRQRIAGGIAFVLAMVLGGTSVSRAEGMRCGNKLVDDGATRGEVRAKCGEPADVEMRSILRRPTYYFHGRRIPYGDSFAEVPVELWTYNFGPNKLMRRIRFVDGVVEDIETLGYGYNDPPPTGADAER